MEIDYVPEQKMCSKLDTVEAFEVQGMDYFVLYGAG